jgi:hypothetical protein
MESVNNYFKKKYKKRAGGLSRANDFLRDNAKYIKLSKPLKAAAVCDAARLVAQGRFAVISFKDGLLTLGINNSSEANNLQLESSQIMEIINKKLGNAEVQKLKFKIVQ